MPSEPDQTFTPAFVLDIKEMLQPEKRSFQLKIILTLNIKLLLDRLKIEAPTKLNAS